MAKFESAQLIYATTLGMVVHYPRLKKEEYYRVIQYDEGVNAGREQVVARTRCDSLATAKNLVRDAEASGLTATIELRRKINP